MSPCQIGVLNDSMRTRAAMWADWWVVDTGAVVGDGRGPVMDGFRAKRTETQYHIEDGDFSMGAPGEVPRLLCWPVVAWCRARAIAMFSAVER